MDYKQLIKIKELYNQTEQGIIKDHIRQLMSDNNVKHATIAQLLDMSIHTSYAYTNKANVGKPDLYNLMILSSYFNVDIRFLFDADKRRFHK